MPVREPPERRKDQIDAEAPDAPNALIVPPGDSYVPDTLATLNAWDPVPRPASAPPRVGSSAFTSSFLSASTQNSPHGDLRSASPPFNAIPTPDSVAGAHILQDETPEPNYSTSSTHDRFGTTLSTLPNDDPAPASMPAGFGEATLTHSDSCNMIKNEWEYLKGFIGVLGNGSSALGPLKATMDNLVQCINTHEDALTTRQDYTTLKAEFEALFSVLKNHFSGHPPPPITASLDNIRCTIEREVDRILGEERQGQMERYQAEDLEEVMECYRRIHNHLERLNFNANPDIWKIEDKQTTEAQLKDLKPSMSACYDSAEADLVRRRECTPQTRTQVLVDLGLWRYDKAQGNLFWLNGMAGTGKTTIASSLCAVLDKSHELGASFFCTRLIPECRNVNLIIPTIAYQLARFSRPFRSALSHVLERHPDIRTKSLSKQLEGMVIAPLLEVARALPTHLVVVIDALDECEDTQGTGKLLEALASRASELPIKLFISSRPEPQIRDKIGDAKGDLILHEIEEPIVKEDIERYLRAELADMSLPESEMHALVERVGVLFIYAAATVRYILSESLRLGRRKRLENVLTRSISGSSNKYKDIDALYGSILASAFNNPDLEDSDRERMKLVLDTVVGTQEPLTVDAMAGLLQLGDADWAHIALRPLWSVLHISGADGLVAPLHTSFLDFMRDTERSEPHTCKAESHHGRLAELCFERIENNDCQFNVCGLESSYVFDKQVPDLEDRVRRAIPLDLEYACRYWAVHLELSGQSNKREQLLRGFLSKRLLLWMEVLNLKNQMRLGATLLERARRWYNQGTGALEIKDLVHDAWRFATMFAANKVSNSTPHIYVSMLASWPSSSPLAGYYMPRTTGLAKVGGTGLNRRQLALLSVFTVGSGVNSFASTPDGMQVASGSGFDSNRIRVWDVQSGQQVLDPTTGHLFSSWVISVALSPGGMYVATASYDATIDVWNVRTRQPLGPLKGHTDSVNSVTFSPDCRRIVSGSSDRTICVWDVQSGQQVLGPLKGHSNSVSSVAFSPDGMHIASGSWDCTIRVWDSKRGQLVLGPLKDHTSLVLSVAFSPDGRRLVSGSWDNAVYVWDVQSGQKLLGPLRDHTNSVDTVAFSPDGLHIISGSSDKTILVWDVRSGTKLLGPLEGHTDSVNSIAFFPDGMRIASGSKDDTICVWDVHSRQQNLKKSKGHTSKINSVSSSPDGMRIVSSSSDKTICLWDAQSGNLALGPLKGHTGPVNSVAFSPDGMRIASGSDDNTICIWGVKNGQQTLGPLKGHTGCVKSVAFSPDGTRILSGADDKTIRVWSVQNGKQVLGPLQGHTGRICSVAFSPDGVRIASGSDDNTIRLWNVHSGKQVLGSLEGHTNTVNSVAFSPGAMRIASGSSDRAICVWDVQSGKLVLGPLDGHTESVNSVAFSHDGMCIVSGSNDRTVCVWDAQSGQQMLRPLMGHTASISSVAFLPDGKHIVSGSYDNRIRVWLDHSNYQTSLTASSPSSESLSSLILNQDGWVIDKNDNLLLWVPPDLRNRLLANRTVLLISTEGSVHLDFSEAKTGESWVDCYIPA